MADSKHTRRALLGSALALILCFAMLLGTTFAWFTDSAETTVNKIQAGTLDIDIQNKGGGSLNGVTMSFEGKGGNDAKLWEPGATYQLPSFKIVNKYDKENNIALAVKCKIVINGFDGNTGTDKVNLLDAIDFVVKYTTTVYKDVSGGNGHYGYVPEEVTVPLEEFCAKEIIIYPAGSTFGNALDNRGETPLFTIVGTMREDAGNEYQGLSLDGLGITVLATQAEAESDLNGNTYDKDATYSA